MGKAKLAVALFLVAIGGTTWAQNPNELFRNLKGMVDQAQKENRSSPQLPSLGATPSSAAEYCDSIKASPMVREYAAVLAKAHQTSAIKVDAGVRNYASLRFDTEDGKLRKWVAAAKSPTGELRKNGTSNFGRAVVSWASFCAAQNHDNDLFLFFIEDIRDPAKVKTQREKARKAYMARGASGQIAKQDFDLGYEGQGFDVDRSSVWVTLAAFALPNGGATAESAGKSAGDTLNAMIGPALAVYEKRTAENQAEQKEKERVETQRIATEDKAKADAERSENSPNGLLLQAYKAFQMVQACYDARKGYAAVYVSEPEFSTAKEKMRQIDSKLKHQIKGVTADQLWGKAAAELGIRPQNVKTAALQQGQMFCGVYKQDMDSVTEKVLGGAVPKKSF